jgi:CheY-like chemotaxis protein
MKSPENCTILIVEDDPLSRDILAEYLRELKFKVIVAEHGFQGLTKAKDFEPDLILLDLMMPRMDGYSFLTKLAEAQLQVPVIVTTALSMLDNVRKVMKLGANSYMVKPIDLNNLKEKLNKILDLNLPIDKSDFNVKITIEDKIVVINLEGNMTVEGLIPIRSDIINKARKNYQKAPKLILNFSEIEPTSATQNSLKELFSFYADLPEPNVDRIKIVTTNEDVKSQIKNHEIAKYMEICDSEAEAFAHM